LRIPHTVNEISVHDLLGLIIQLTGMQDAAQNPEMKHFALKTVNVTD
jgi:hypothetical protein